MATIEQSFDLKAANLFTTGIPTLVLANGTNFPLSGYAFNDTTLNAVYINLNAIYYLSGNLTVTVEWYSAAGNITGNVMWGIQIGAVTSGDPQSLLTKALATAQTNASTVNGTASGLRDGIVTVTNLDSLAAGDWVQVRLYRDAADVGDTMAGDAVATILKVAYAATAGAGAGNVSNAGGAIDNHVVRFDLATGQVIQDGTNVVLDDSSNISGVAQYNGATQVLTSTATASRFLGPTAYGAMMTATQANSTVTLADVTSFVVALPLGTYDFKVKGLWQSAATTTGLKLSARMATGAGSTYTGACAITTGAAGATETASQTTLNTVMGGVTGPAAAVSVPFDFWGRLTVTTAGNFAIQFASEVAASAVTLQVGSMLEITQVA